MANNLQTDSEPKVSTLVSGILDDLQALIKQQLALFQHEIHDDFQKSKEAAVSLIVGFGIALLACLMLSHMLVHLLHWAVPELPLWGAFGIVGGLLALGGLGLFLAGWLKFRSFNPLPDESAQAMKENVEWIVNRK